MTRQPRARTIALAAGLATVAVALAAGFALKDPLLEEWYLRDLERYDEVKSREAAVWFGQHGSPRAMKRLFDLARELARRPDAEATSSRVCNSMVRIGEALERIAIERRREVVPLLVSLLREKPAYPAQGNQVRIGAAHCLGKIGPDAREALPALREALKDEDARFRKNVAQAIDDMEPGSRFHE